MSEVKEIILPSGKVARIHPFLGKHVKRATEQAQEKHQTENVLYLMLAQIVEIDGNPVVVEDFDEMSGEDLLAIQANFAGKFSAMRT